MNFAVWLFRWPICLLLICIVNFSAVSGPFLFDDFSNLDGLISVDQGTKSALDFVLDGRAGPTGRPVTLATFLWPSEAFPNSPLLFKLTNLIIHLLNTLLVYGVAKMVLRAVGLKSEQAATAAIIAMFFWGVHPINQSAVFLVIQRMTLLMTFFSLMAIFVFIKYRDDLKDPLTFRSLTVILCIGVLGILSLLSKEAGVILPIFLLVIQATIFSQSEKPISRLVCWGVIYLPSLIVVFAFFYWVLFRSNPEFINRDFNMFERALTQSRVMVDYLSQIFIPRLSGSGLFHDDYVVSRSLWNPITTIWAIGFIVFSTVLFVYKRKYWKVASFAALFYLVGHLIESTFLNLELYFEHRNYLPSVGVAIALGYGAVKLKTVFKPLLIIYGLLLAFIGTYNAYSWGELGRIAQLSAMENPTSVRAQVFLARYWGDVGNYKKATDAIKKAIELRPLDGTSHIQLAVHNCINKGSLGDSGLDILANGIHRADFYNLAMSNAAELMVQILKLDACKGYDAKELAVLFLYILDSDKLTGRTSKYNLAFQISQLYLLQRDFAGYMNALERTYQIYPNLQVINLQLKTLFSNELHEDALLYIKRGRGLVSNGRESSVELHHFEKHNLAYSNFLHEKIK